MFLQTRRTRTRIDKKKSPRGKKRNSLTRNRYEDGSGSSSNATRTSRVAWPRQKANTLDATRSNIHSKCTPISISYIPKARQFIYENCSSPFRQRDAPARLTAYSRSRDKQREYSSIPSHVPVNCQNENEGYTLDASATIARGFNRARRRWLVPRLGDALQPRRFRRTAAAARVEQRRRRPDVAAAAARAARSGADGDRAWLGATAARCGARAVRGDGGGAREATAAARGRRRRRPVGEAAPPAAEAPATGDGGAAAGRTAAHSDRRWRRSAARGDGDRWRCGGRRCGGEATAAGRSSWRRRARQWGGGGGGACGGGREMGRRLGGGQGSLMPPPPRCPSRPIRGPRPRWGRCSPSPAREREKKKEEKKNEEKMDSHQFGLVEFSLSPRFYRCLG